MRKKAKRYKNKPTSSKRTKKKMIKTFLFLFSIIFIVLIILSGIKIYDWIKDNINSTKILDEISDKVVIDNTKNNNDIDKYTVNFEELIKKNSDTIGWLKINETQIEYSVVKAKDNNYYLTHDFDKNDNSAGWVFADYRNKIDGTDKNIVIYGHNRRDGSMFGSLKKALIDDWHNNEENRKIMFFTKSEKSIYEVFSIYKVEKEDYYIQTSFSTNTAYKNFLNTIKNRSIKDFNVDITSDDQILTLSTCDNNNKYRIVVHAKKTTN